MQRIYRLYYFFLSKFNDNEPTPKEVEYLFLNSKLSQISWFPTKDQKETQILKNKRRLTKIIVLYSIDSSFEEIAKIFGVTGERIRQIIRKFCRDAWRELR